MRARAAAEGDLARALSLTCDAIEDRLAVNDADRAVLLLHVGRRLLDDRDALDLLADVVWLRAARRFRRLARCLLGVRAMVDAGAVERMLSLVLRGEDVRLESAMHQGCPVRFSSTTE